MESFVNSRTLIAMKNKNIKKSRHYSHNKWLLYSSTLILISFLLVVDHISVVECGLQSLTSAENETTGKSKEKAKLIFGNSISNVPGRGFVGKPGIGGNEIHSTKFDFNDIDEEDDEGGDSYPDEDASYAYESYEEVKGTDADYIKEYEKEKKPFGKPKMGKCCDYGYGLDVKGSCEKINPKHLKQHDKLWFPKELYDDKIYSMIPTNITEWDIRVSHGVECAVDERIEIVSDMGRFTLLKGGSLYILEHKKVIQPLDYCMEQELGKGERRVVRACFSQDDLCTGKQCLKKCCPEGSIAEEPRMRCSRSTLTESYNLKNHNRSILSSIPSCEFGFHLNQVQGTYNISVNGSFATSDFEAPFLSYCLDYFLSIDKPHNTPLLKAMVCFNHDGSTTDKPNSSGLVIVPPGVAVIFGIANIISAVCLAIAALISWRLPELRSLHGKCQLSHLATMFCLYVCLAITQIGSRNIPQGLCTFIGVFIHICALSSFLWLNLLCVNIYLTFRSLRPPLAARRDENRRLFFLCTYAWGIPAMFCIFLFLVDSGRLDPMPRPEYGKLVCLISNREAEFAYLFGPVGVLLLCNGILFCLTAQELLCGLWRSDNSDSINFRRKSMGIVVAKLGIVMGLGWILDVLSWAVGNKSPYMFYAIDLFNSLQGVFISIILLWRKRVLEVLHLRRPSITKDETLTVRPFLPKNSGVNIMSNGDHDTSLVLGQDQ